MEEFVPLPRGQGHWRGQGPLGWVPAVVGRPPHYGARGIIRYQGPGGQGHNRRALAIQHRQNLAAAATVRQAWDSRTPPGVEH